MIVPMLKYSFLVFHQDYISFLEELQDIGVVHVVQKEIEVPEDIKRKYAEINRYSQAIEFLKKRETDETKKNIDLKGEEILKDIIQKQTELEQLSIELEETDKELAKARRWGSFSAELIQKLEAENIHLHFYSSNRKNFQHLKNSGLPVEIISEHGNQLLFIHIKTDEEKTELDAEKMHLPQVPFPELELKITELETRIIDINACFDKYAADSIAQLESCKSEQIELLSLDEVFLNTSKQAENKLMVLEGWVPKTKILSINSFLEINEILYLAEKAKPSDKIPVLLNNNRFSKLFEPIGSMFSLPDYAELDLTVFFAPFFMMFFGFCLGDAGYGLLFLIGAGIYKLKAKKEFKPYLSLIQLLGLATIIFGAVSGTFFGINLIETEIALTDRFRNLFLDPNKMFNLSIALGGIQIVFGLFIRAVNRTRQYGFSYSLATYGWLIILLGSISYVILSDLGIIQKNKIILYLIMAVGGFFILFFSDPGVNIFVRIGKGVWDIYSTVTGIFGDLLSYIRLFALGLSSAILGFVINDIGLQILGSSKILGPIFFAIFLILGHTLNILISSLGSFVHPMRLTFVEFYKSAGFTGGGEEYKPFKR
ncbi:MAG: V-type ATPase 116kDa subunit family protein [Bacteroidota bacterium]